MTVQIKICGITCISDAQCACTLGADYIGIVVNIAGSHRSVSTQQAAEISLGIPKPVLLMEGPIKPIITTLRRIKPHAVQLIGPYTPEDIKSIKEESGVQIWKPVRVPRSDDGMKHNFEQQLDELQHAAIDALVLDTLVPGHKGGTGQTCDWNTAARIVNSANLPVFLAGGLTPENVAHAIAEVKPYGVDVSSGVESSPGNKDLQKVSRFILKANESQKP